MAPTTDITASLTNLPTPDHLTLLFKCHKSTTLLSVEPTQPLSEITQMLLAALKSRSLNTFPHSTTPLPTDAKDIELGVLVDRKDPSKGWTLLDTKENDGNDAGIKGGKKKAGPVMTSGKKANAPSSTPLGAGLVDGSWIAYRPKSSTEGLKKEEDEEDDEMVDIDVSEDPGWDVILPNFEDEEAE